MTDVAPKDTDKILIDFRWKRMDDPMGNRWVHLYVILPSGNAVLLATVSERLAEQGGTQLMDELVRVVARLGLKSEVAPSATVQ